MSTVTPIPPAASDGALMTADELLAAGDLGRCELLDGRLHLLAPTGGDHSRIAGRTFNALFAYEERTALGVAFGSDAGFILRRNPDRVRAPDAAFLLRSRLPAGPLRTFLEGAPDVAVEVNSPSDRPGGVLQKTREWLAAGARQVWVLDPESRTVTVHSLDGPPRILGEVEVLDGGDLLPGFSVPVAKLFG